MRFGQPIRARASLTAAASVSVFASVTNTRWSLRWAFIGWRNCTTSTSIDFYESGTHIIGYGVQTTSGHARIDFGDDFLVASDTNTRLSLNTDAGGRITGYFTGHRR